MLQVDTARCSAHEREVRAAASKWLIELETTSSLEAIWPEFQTWLHEDPEHKSAYLRVERAWHALDALRHPDLTEGSPEASLLLGTDSRRLRRPLRWALVAVVILAALLLAVLGRA